MLGARVVLVLLKGPEPCGGPVVSGTRRPAVGVGCRDASDPVSSSFLWDAASIEEFRCRVRVKLATHINAKAIFPSRILHCSTVISVIYPAVNVITEWWNCIVLQLSAY